MPLIIGYFEKDLRINIFPKKIGVEHRRGDLRHASQRNFKINVRIVPFSR